jgi:Protein of unknown function (DUF1493)
MTLSPEQALYDSVLDFVSSETSTRKQHLSGNTDIARDLGVDGDEAEEFMLKFQRECDVDLSNFRSDRYFGGQGVTLIPFIKLLLGKGEVRDPLTITDLFAAANHRRWPENAPR